jgi:uncharacterized protein (TIGR03437 family)
MCDRCMATADFDGDGKMDIVYTVDELTPFDGVLMGNGDGTFRPGETLNYPHSGGIPFAADFNGDGKPDIVITGTGTSLYLGDGKGGFAAPIQVIGCDAASVVADVNGDGRQDLICETVVLLSNGDGTFREAASKLEGSAQVAADFNDDGKLDLVILSGPDQIAVALGHGDGTFNAGMIVDGSYTLHSIYAADFNNDGKLDLLIPNSINGNSSVVLPGRGDGTFGLAIGLLFADNPIQAVADFNRDGNLDLVAGDAILAGNGDGTFRFPVFFGAATDPCGVQPGGVTWNCEITRAGRIVADFNGDGLPDLAASQVTWGLYYKRATVSTLLNNSPGDGFTATGVSAADAGVPVGPVSMVSAYGVDLAPKTESAATNPAPTTLGGIRLHVRDRSHAEETLATLLYVSPTQINYILPSDDPYAWVSVERVGSPYVPTGMAVPIAPLAPGLFTVGDGLAAANAVRITPDGTVTQVPVVSCSGATCSLVPIDVSSGQVYLSLYGTGFAQASADLTRCSVDAGHKVTFLAVSYAGPQIQTAGLDQINVLLPKSLAGAGRIWMNCLFHASLSLYQSNAVQLQIQ